MSCTQFRSHPVSIYIVPPRSGWMTILGAVPPSPRSRSLTRQEIVAAALRLIQERGLSRPTMRAVPAELGVTPMATYYIEDKDDLLRLVVEDVISSCIPLPKSEEARRAASRRGGADARLGSR